MILQLAERPAEAGRPILVTGSAGFIGMPLCSALRTALGHLTLVGVSRRDVDLADNDAVRRLFATVQPKVVVHLAASVRRGEASAQTQARDTLDSGTNVVKAAVESGVGHLLIAGSIEELGEQGGPLPPEAPSRPVTDYGKAKHALRIFTEQQSTPGDSMIIDWFRPFTVYGPGQVGEMLVPYAFHCAENGLPGEFSSGEQARDFLFVGDLVRWIVEKVRAPNVIGRTHPFALHHVGTGVATTVQQVLREIAKHYPAASFDRAPRKPGSSGPLSQYASEPCFDDCTPVNVGMTITAEWWKTGQSSAR